jgi:hypothetical protein
LQKNKEGGFLIWVIPNGRFILINNLKKHSWGWNMARYCVGGVRDSKRGVRYMQFEENSKPQKRTLFIDKSQHIMRKHEIKSMGLDGVWRMSSF